MCQSGIRSGDEPQPEAYKQFVLSSSEKEGHILFIERRQVLWDKLKDLVLDNLLSELSELYVKLKHNCKVKEIQIFTLQYPGENIYQKWQTDQNLRI